MYFTLYSGHYPWYFSCLQLEALYGPHAGQANCTKTMLMSVMLYEDESWCYGKASTTLNRVLITYNAMIRWSCFKQAASLSLNLFKLLPTTVRKHSNLCQTQDFIIESLITLCLYGSNALIAIKIRVAYVYAEIRGTFVWIMLKEKHVFRDSTGNHVLAESIFLLNQHRFFEIPFKGISHCPRPFAWNIIPKIKWILVDIFKFQNCINESCWNIQFPYLLHIRFILT